MNKTRSVVVVGFIVCLPFLCSVAVQSVYLAIEHYQQGRDIRFNKEVWGSVSGQDAGRRYARLQMVNDVIKNVVSVGDSRKTVLEILGPPDEENYLGWDFLYWVSPHIVDSKWLAINLDPLGKVSEIALIHD